MEGEGVAPDIAAQISQLKMASSSISTPTTTDDSPPVTTPAVDMKTPTNVTTDTESAALFTSDLKEPNPRPHPTTSTSMIQVHDTDKRIPEPFSKDLSDEQEQEQGQGAAAVEELLGHETTDEKVGYEYEDEEEEEVVLKEGGTYERSDYTTSASSSSHIDTSVTPAPEVYPATPPAIRAIRRRLVGERALHTTTTITASTTATTTTATTTATATFVNNIPAVVEVQEQRMNGYDTVDGTLKSILVLLGAYIVFLSYKMIDILFGPLI